MTVSILIDYTYDTQNFFNTQARRDLIQLAASTLGTALNDSLTAIVPAGGNSWQATFPSPNSAGTQTINNLYVPANSIIVYVGGRALPGMGEAGDGSTGGFSAQGDQGWLDNIAARGQAGALAAPPTDYGPWGGSIAFDNAATNWYFGTDTSGLTASQTDFLTVAEHELGHVLGIGTTASWQALVKPQGFIGPAAEAAHGGAPVGVAPDQGHWAEGTMSDGQLAAMDPVLLNGTRDLFTTLDYAGLKDVGWQVTPPPPAPIVQASAPNFSVLENAGTATVTLTRTGGSGAFSVHFSTIDGSARAGVDYAATSSRIAFANGENSQSIIVPLLFDTNPDGGESFTVRLDSPLGGAVLGSVSQPTVTISDVNGAGPPAAPVLDAASDTGVSPSDGITKNNGTAGAPLSFTVAGANPTGSYLRLYDVTDPTRPTLLAGPTQAANGAVHFNLSGAPLSDGVHRIAATGALTPSGAPSGYSPGATIAIQTSVTITATSPADGSAVAVLPGGMVTVTLSHPLAGLTDGGPALGSNDPYAVFLLQRGPDLAFSAPSGIDGGTLPLHANTIYHVNADGSSSITITPSEPLSSDVYGISIGLSAFSDLAGNPLTDPTGNPPGYRTFLLQRPPVTTTALQVVGVSSYNGYTAVNNNVIVQPDTLAIAFNKPLWQGAAGGSNVQLLANNGGAISIVPSVATYSPSTRSIYLTPAAILTPGTTYIIRVDGSVSDDQGFSGPDSQPGGTLGQTFYDTFNVVNPPAGAGQGPFTVARDQAGNPLLLPGKGLSWSVPLGYASVAFTERMMLPTSIGNRYSVMLDPRTTGTDNNQLLTNIPLNAKLAFNPNTNQLIIVPTQLVGNDVYLFSLSALQSSQGDPLLNDAGRQAGITGPPFFATFGLQVAGPLALTSVSQGAAEFARAAGTPVSAPPVNATASRPPAGTSKTTQRPIRRPAPEWITRRPSPWLARRVPGPSVRAADGTLLPVS